MEKTEKNLQRLRDALEGGPSTFLSEMNMMLPPEYPALFSETPFRVVVEALFELGFRLTIERVTG